MRLLLGIKRTLAVCLVSLSMVGGSGYAWAKGPSSPQKADDHEVIVLNHGLASFEQRLQMIERAKRTIEVEYYIYRTDKSGRVFTQALLKKAKEGVKIKMLIDYFPVRNDFTAFYAHELEKAGIEVRFFNVVTILDLVPGQFRNHKKLLIIDGEEAMTGGRNIGDEYYEMNKKYNFVDRDIYVKGSIVSSMQKSFYADFNAEKSEALKREPMPEMGEPTSYEFFKYERDMGVWERKVQEAVDFVTVPLDGNFYELIRQKGRELLEKEYRGSCSNMRFYSDLPLIGKKETEDKRILKTDFLRRIKEAKQSIVMDSAYSILNNELAVALSQALANNVEVSLLTNSINSIDSVSVYTLFDDLADEWLRKGLKMYIFKGQKPENYEMVTEKIKKSRFGIHSKTYIFDDQDVVIGSYNADPRSANYNIETYVACEENPEMAAAVLHDINVRKKASLYLDSHEAISDAQSYQVGFFKQFLFYFTKIPANLFSHLM